MRFCGHCGSSLALRCPACGTESQPGFRFCGACGTGLGTAPAPDAAESGESTENTGSQEATPAPQAAERRQTTVLFCDLVDSTRLSDELDPEDLREVIRRYQAAAALIVDQYSGHIAQYLGDGLLIYFGYPTAQEDDAQRAVDAGLQILGAVGKLRTPTGEPLRARVGVHTGLGVAGEMGGGNAKREQLVVGKTPNVAARLQGLAEPNALVISSATHQLVAPYFVSRALGPQRLKGISEPVDAFVVERHSEIRARFEGAMLRGLTPLVGREAELAILTDRYRRAVAGRGQTVLLAAEAGVGKSRMLHATLGAANADTTRLTAHCAPNAQTSSLMPVVELLRQLVGITRTDRPAEALQKLRECLVRQHTPDAEGLALLAGFLSLPLPSGVAAPVLSAQKLRERTLRLLRRMLVAEAQTKSVIVVFEDLHWVDPSTLEFVEQLMDEGSKSSLLLLLTARPAFRAPWSFRPYLTTITLLRLTEAESRLMIERACNGKPMPPEVVAQIQEKSDGVPLYIEELTRATLESGLLVEHANRWELTRPMEPVQVPATLRDSLASRLDRLGPPRELAQLASVIGRSFSFELLRAVSPSPVRSLRRQLDQLLGAEILVVEDASNGLEVYRFKHALIQETAYDTMLRSRRREIHRLIAHTIERRFSELVESRPELLARHFEEAEMLDESSSYSLMAGQRLMRTGAYTEAISEFLRAITLVGEMEAGPARYRRELELRTALSGSFVATRGYCAPELEANIQQSRELCSLLGNPPELMPPTLYGLWVTNLASSRREATELYARELMDFAAASEDPMVKVTAHFAQGTTELYRGRLEAGRATLGLALHFYNPAMHPALIGIYGDDHGMFAAIYLQWLELLTGQPDRARAWQIRNLEIVELRNDPLGLAMALALSMLLRHDLRDVEGTATLAERTAAISTEQGFPFWGALAQCGLGWLASQRGEHENAIQLIQGGLSFFHLIQQKLPLTYWTTYLVDAQLAAGQVEAGLTTVNEAIAMAEANVDRFFLPELLRLKGELLRVQEPQSEEALALFEQAIRVAREMGAFWLELRAATSAGRLLLATGNDVRARRLLEAATGKLREGFSTPDYLEAMALLGESPSP